MLSTSKLLIIKLTYHKNNSSLHEIKMMAEIILTLHNPETSHWAQLATKIRVDNTKIVVVVVFIVVEMFREMSIE